MLRKPQLSREEERFIQRCVAVVRAAQAARARHRGRRPHAPARLPCACHLPRTDVGVFALPAATSFAWR